MYRERSTRVGLLPLMKACLAFYIPTLIVEQTVELGVPTADEVRQVAHSSLPLA